MCSQEISTGSYFGIYILNILRGMANLNRKLIKISLQSATSITPPILLLLTNAKHHSRCRYPSKYITPPMKLVQFMYNIKSYTGKTKMETK
jgi:hypothetical protein